MRLALLGMHHSVLPSSPRMTDRHSPAGTALPGSAVFSARAPQIKQRKAAAAKQDAGQQQNRPEAGRHQVPFQACMQGAIPVHETDRMQAGEYPRAANPPRPQQNSSVPRIRGRSRRLRTGPAGAGRTLSSAGGTGTGMSSRPAGAMSSSRLVCSTSRSRAKPVDVRGRQACFPFGNGLARNTHAGGQFFLRHAHGFASAQDLLPKSDPCVFHRKDCGEEKKRGGARPPLRQARSTSAFPAHHHRTCTYFPDSVPAGVSAVGAAVPA